MVDLHNPRIRHLISTNHHDCIHRTTTDQSSEDQVRHPLPERPARALLVRNAQRKPGIDLDRPSRRMKIVMKDLVSNPAGNFATPRVAAGALFVDGERALLVRKTYGERWDTDCPINGVTGVDGSQAVPGTIRPSKVIANALSAGFQRIDHLVRPFPVGSSDRVTR